jgi:hypothetical protein
LITAVQSSLLEVSFSKMGNSLLWSSFLREEHRLRVFENRVLRRILHNEDLHDLYSLPSIIRIIKSRMMRWVRHVAHMGEKRNVYRLLVEKSQGKRKTKTKVGG